MKSNFLFSIIIPVYNAADYLRETIDSVLNQSIGFSDNIQILLVNDGSSDDSEVICKEYKQMYPDNIEYIYQDNQGVSYARNNGLSHVLGSYVNFLDSDDYWDQDAFEKVYEFFKKHENEVDVVSCRLIQFGARTDIHPLDYRYKTTSVIDLNDNPTFISPMIGNCFFKSSAIDLFRFDTSYTYGEDTIFLNQVILDKCAYGVVSDAAYNYRKRADGTSLSQNLSKSRFIQGNLFCERLFDLSRQRYGSVLPFIQDLALYEIKWRLFTTIAEEFTEEEAESFNLSLRRIVSEIDDNLLIAERKLSFSKRVFLYKLKYGNDFFEHVEWMEQGDASYNDVLVFKERGGDRCSIKLLNVKDGNLILEGTSDIGMLGLGARLFAEDENGNRVYASLHPFPVKDIRTLTGEKIFEGTRFVLILPVERTVKYKVYVRFCNGVEIKLNPSFGIFAKLNQKVKTSYWTNGEIIIKYFKGSIRVYKYSLRTHIASEMRYCRSVFKKTTFKTKALRAIHFLTSPFKRSDIWIVNDRDYKAGDNGENLFKYALSREEVKDKKLYFSIEKSSPDYSRIKSFGKTLEPYSLKFGLYFLMADKIISPHSDGPITNPFGGQGDYLKDLFSYRYVCLSHGTLQGELANWLNRLNQNISLFIVSTEMERNVLVGDLYAYSNDEVIIAGMARYDAFANARTERLIAFLPTWRSGLAGKLIPGTREREYVPNFSDNYYCKFYNDLINDSRLVAAMKQYGYRGEFYVHPSFEKQSGDFVGNETISVGHGMADYESVLSKAALMVTDYSGVGFDFGYQRKPIVYCHFDNVFSTNHSYGSSYFSYEDDGFGPVTYDLDSAVEEIVKYMARDCRQYDFYKDRADKFYAFNDYDNCERVFNAIIDMDA